MQADESKPLASDGAMLEGNERLDDLMADGLQIIQSRDVFSFSMDAVLLSRFAAVPKRGRVLDLCTGNGVVALLLTTRTSASIDAVEIQPRLADMARRSVAFNNLGHRVTIIDGDLREYHLQAGYGKYDAITINPPYMAPQTGDANRNAHYAIARHEIECSLNDAVAACARLVRTGGYVSMVHRPGRLADIMVAMRQWKLEPKRIRFVHPYRGSEANMVLIEAIRNGKPDVRLLPPLIVYEHDQQYTQELMDIYYGP